MIEYPIILASTSPRRKELLQQIGVKFEIVPSQAFEAIEKELSPREAVRVLAKRKANNIASVRPEALVIAADTVTTINVSFNERLKLILIFTIAFYYIQ